MAEAKLGVFYNDDIAWITTVRIITIINMITFLTANTKEKFGF